MIYLYDLGDNWRHELVLERILPADDSATTPVCLAGERRCPPEDCGGPHGYQEFLDVIFQPGHEDFERYREWAGNPVHAEQFDLKAVNEILDRMRHFVNGSQLWQNRGNLQFEPMAQKYQIAAVGWAYGPALVDLDNDGWLDLYATSGFVSRDRGEPDG